MFQSKMRGKGREEELLFQEVAQKHHFFLEEFCIEEVYRRGSGYVEISREFS